jgi:hypothetical protein
MLFESLICIYKCVFMLEIYRVSYDESFVHKLIYSYYLPLSICNKKFIEEPVNRCDMNSILRVPLFKWIDMYICNLAK